MYSFPFFDEIIDRRGTSSVKYDDLNRVFGREDVLPLWIADMDFRVAREISDAIKARAEHDIYAYTFHSQSFFRSAVDWVQRRHHWTVQPEWLSFSPGVVPAINMCVLAFTDPGNKIIIQTPVYPPFYAAIGDHDREIARNPLVKNNNSYEMDFDHLESIIDKKCKMLILCHPHNPAGRIWTRQELERLAAICVRHRLIVVCDMIHSDFMLGHQPCPSFADISPEIAALTLSLIAPSKTFNIAGLSTSLIFTSNPVLKAKYEKLRDSLHIGMGNIFGTVALEAAYRYGDAWLDGLLNYLNANFDIIDKWTARADYVRYIRSEGTYLAWLDFSPSGLSGDALYDTIIRKAKAGLSRGREFGVEGESFMRMNLACSASILRQAIRQMDEAFQNLHTACAFASE
jgi:cystathionine beta-lyase